MQAGSFYKNAQVTVLNCRSVPECYSVLSVMDFEQDVSDAVESANSILADTYQYSVYRAVKDVNYESKSIRRNEFFALSGKTLLNVRDTLEDAVLDTADKALKERGADIVTVYYGKDISPDYIELLTEKLEALGDGVEVIAVSTFENSYDITITLE
jgi:dihydroxyacetone kinase-like predicted kinase